MSPGLRSGRHGGAVARTVRAKPASRGKRSHDHADPPALCGQCEVQRAHIGYFFGKVPLQERLTAARAADFSAVEHPNRCSKEAARLRVILGYYGLVFAQIEFAAADPAQGEKGLAALSEERERFKHIALRDLDFAAEIEARFVRQKAGVRRSGVAHDVLWKIYLDSHSLVAETANEHGMHVLIEPIGRGTIAVYLMDTMSRAIEELIRQDISTLLDVFPGINDDLDPCEQIREHAALIGHIHVADHPRRHEPMTGTLNFQSTYRQLEAIGYGGILGCEYIPQNGDTSEPFVDDAGCFEHGAITTKTSLERKVAREDHHEVQHRINSGGGHRGHGRNRIGSNLSDQGPSDHDNRALNRRRWNGHGRASDRAASGK